MLNIDLQTEESVEYRIQTEGESVEYRSTNRRGEC